MTKKFIRAWIYHILKRCEYCGQKCQGFDNEEGTKTYLCNKCIDE